MSSCSTDLTSDPRQSLSSDIAHSSTAPRNNDNTTLNSMSTAVMLSYRQSIESKHSVQTSASYITRLTFCLSYALHRLSNMSI